MKNIAPIFRGVVKEGRLFIRDKGLFENHLREMDGDVDVIVRIQKKIRSDKENRYYWGVVIPILCKHFGYTKDEMHAALGVRFYAEHSETRVPLLDLMVAFMERIGTPPNITRQVRNFMDSHLRGIRADKNPPRIKSMTAMTTVEFEDKMTEIRAWAATEHGIFIPLPNETLPQKE